MVGTIFRKTKSTTVNPNPVIPNKAFQALPIKVVPDPSYSVALDDYKIVMSNAGARSVQMPQVTSDGISFSISDGSGTSDSSPITITSFGADTFGETGTTTFVIESSYASVTFRYDLETTQWWTE
jgi:hypothetical protein